MAGANSYIPSSHPMTSRRGVSGSQSTQMVLTCRPPPPNHKMVVRNKNIHSTPISKPPYVEDFTGAEMWHHSCSPAGVRGGATIGHEFSDDRADNVGVFRPPLQPYKAGRLLYKKCDSWVLAAAAVLTSVRTEHSGSEITADVVQNTHDLLEKQTVSNIVLATPNTMYHRADRCTMIFSNEPEITKILEFLGYDLVVLCPLMPASGMG
jgi:hypothetical protein